MGARPVALLNSLRFGSLDAARNRYLVTGVVRGIGDYGNCVGVPTVGGEVDFGPGYAGNPLVNAMCVGVLRERDLIKAVAHGVGNVLLVVGSRTGRDGIHGASFASEELTHESERRRPQVQVGDPFSEKLLLEARLIGRVTDDGMYRVKWRDQVVAEIPSQRLIEDCPVYYPEAIEDPRIIELRRKQPPPVSRLPPPDEVLLRLLDHPPIASKRWVYEQYDSTVQAGTALGPGGGDAAVIRVRGADWGLAVCTDGNARYVLLDPYEGGKAAVAEAARNVACTGARPLGITDCLNFGSPERPAVFDQFQEACRGIADACRALGTPVTGGNVSFYNESPTGAVDPTPVVGMVGLLGRADRAVPSHARERNDVVLVLGETRPELGGSALWEVMHGAVCGEPPRVDLEAERRLIDFLVAAAVAGGGVGRPRPRCPPRGGRGAPPRGPLGGGGEANPVGVGGEPSPFPPPPNPLPLV